MTMTTEDRALLEEMLTNVGDKRTVEEFMKDIKDANLIELRTWHRDARAMRAAFSLVLDILDGQELDT